MNEFQETLNALLEELEIYTLDNNYRMMTYYYDQIGRVIAEAHNRGMKVNLVYKNATSWLRDNQNG